MRIAACLNPSNMSRANVLFGFGDSDVPKMLSRIWLESCILFGIDVRIPHIRLTHWQQTIVPSKKGARADIDHKNHKNGTTTALGECMLSRTIEPFGYVLDFEGLLVFFDSRKKAPEARGRH